MNSELFGFLIGIVFIVVQAIFMCIISKILSILTDRILSEK